MRKNLGFEICNDVAFNQVLVRWKDDDATRTLIDKIQSSGVLWLGGSVWKGKAVMRISVCSYKTTYEDIDICVEKIAQLAG